jgi:excisionase family DNA binding protein
LRYTVVDKGANVVATDGQDSELLSIPRLAAYLSLAERTVVMWAQQGRIPAFKVGSIWRFRKGDIDEWLESQRTGPNLAPLKDPDEGFVPGPFKSLAREREIKTCIEAIEARLQNSDQNVWVVYEFQLNYGEAIADEAIARLIKTKKIKKGISKVQGKQIQTILRR